ncbi:uncharacterized protein BT62DRAFT_998966 [Guyanagaster necrorhizus]|uniref:Uncharacterized protein n=1 Tax=Guyanagaster necrorhizus TaxID=856835 RepID=A0A9P7W5H1_9AGAR|nr:uncharacterized protein BT62DRAFT_998966 [Guyanagaster necrorhizus MCA 3950]KAG7452949.1 hypothetical protein BT62DRAFT_998966 [Guyanagaster necrorhizus MCA 3950]
MPFVGIQELTTCNRALENVSILQEGTREICEVVNSWGGMLRSGQLDTNTQKLRRQDRTSNVVSCSIEWPVPQSHPKLANCWPRSWMFPGGICWSQVLTDCFCDKHDTLRRHHLAHCIRMACTSPPWEARARKLADQIGTRFNLKPAGSVATPNLPLFSGLPSSPIVFFISFTDSPADAYCGLCFRRISRTAKPQSARVAPSPFAPRHCTLQPRQAGVTPSRGNHGCHDNMGSDCDGLSVSIWKYQEAWRTWSNAAAILTHPAHFQNSAGVRMSKLPSRTCEDTIFHSTTDMAIKVNNPAYQLDGYFQSSPPIQACSGAASQKPARTRNERKDILHQHKFHPIALWVTCRGREISILSPSQRVPGPDQREEPVHEETPPCYPILFVTLPYSGLLPIVIVLLSLSFWHPFITDSIPSSLRPQERADKAKQNLLNSWNT